ncbi:GNAT family N-acetyltransferase [Streptomyces sp. NBC_00239]|uniref:GNAT family N-acetyltransferase n=1 Tax=Streptomyces sp. NBC_00239 TaxID=2903640 RepID=UPI002E283ED3|nr:GNAT family N-acetyltransferase [Streptomyces sp. NBC_00239]
MGVEIRDERAAGRLEAYEDGVAAGFVAYFVLAQPTGDPAALVAVHTVVEPGREGRGIGGDLVRALYGMAAAEEVAVVPLCPYAAAWARKHPDAAPAAPAALVEAAQAQLEADPSLW